MVQMQTSSPVTNKPVMLVLHDIDLNSKLSLLRALRGAGYVVLNTPDGVDVDRALSMMRNADAGVLILWASDERSVTWLKAMIKALQAADTHIPLVIGGPAINTEIAQAVAQVDDEMYRGIYDYADTDEILQIFKYIVFYTPPPPAHSHEHEDEEEACGIVDEGCATCASNCPMNKA